MRRNLAETGRWFCLDEMLTNDEHQTRTLDTPSTRFMPPFQVIASPSPFHVILQTEFIDYPRDPTDLRTPSSLDHRTSSAPCRVGQILRRVGVDEIEPSISQPVIYCPLPHFASPQLPSARIFTACPANGFVARSKSRGLCFLSRGS